MKRCISRFGANLVAEGITGWVWWWFLRWQNFRIEFRQVSGNATRKCELWPGSCLLCSICFRKWQSGSTPRNTTATPSPQFSSFPGPKKTFIFANHWNPGIGEFPKENVTLQDQLTTRCLEKMDPFWLKMLHFTIWNMGILQRVVIVYQKGRIFIFMASPIFRFVVSNRVEASFVDSAAGAHEIGCAERLSLGVAWAKGTVMWR